MFEANMDDIIFYRMKQEIEFSFVTAPHYVYLNLSRSFEHLLYWEKQEVNIALLRNALGLYGHCIQRCDLPLWRVQSHSVTKIQNYWGEKLKEHVDYVTDRHCQLTRATWEIFDFLKYLTTKSIEGLPTEIRQKVAENAWGKVITLLDVTAEQLMK